MMLTNGLMAAFIEIIVSLRVAGQFKSMLDLGSEGGRRPSSPSVMPEIETSSSSCPRNTVDAEVRICINDVTVDSTDDFSQDSGQENELTIGYLKKQQKRRSSWCPEEGKKREEKREKARMLGIQGRRSVLVYNLGFFNWVSKL